VGDRYNVVTDIEQLLVAKVSLPTEEVVDAQAELQKPKVCE
jgi:hypothetical protein